jgi:hypothetical protein
MSHISISLSLVHDSVEIYMDDLTVNGNTFQEGLINLKYALRHDPIFEQ